MGRGSKPVELRWITIDASAARHPVGGGVVLNLRIRLGPSQRASSWLSGAEIHPAPNAALNICDGGDAIGCAYVAKLTLLGTSCIDVHASACAYGCRAKKIQWAGTLQ
jgi:hypothetical protein